MAGLPDGAALEGLGRFRQQRPHFRHFTGPNAKGVGQIFYDPVVVQVPLAPNCNDVVLTFLISGIY